MDDLDPEVLDRPPQDFLGKIEVAGRLLVLPPLLHPIVRDVQPRGLEVAHHYGAKLLTRPIDKAAVPLRETLEVAFVQDRLALAKRSRLRRVERNGRPCVLRRDMLLLRHEGFSVVVEGLLGGREEPSPSLGYLELLPPRRRRPLLRLRDREPRVQPRHSGVNRAPENLARVRGRRVEVLEIAPHKLLLAPLHRVEGAEVPEAAAHSTARRSASSPKTLSSLTS